MWIIEHNKINDEMFIYSWCMRSNIGYSRFKLIKSSFWLSPCGPCGHFAYGHRLYKCGFSFGRYFDFNLPHRLCLPFYGIKIN